VRVPGNCDQIGKSNTFYNVIFKASPASEVSRCHLWNNCFLPVFPYSGMSFWSKC